MTKQEITEKVMCEYLPKISTLFKKYSIKSITMDDIARELGISKKTLYQYFDNKKDVVSKVTQYELKNECDELNKLCIKHKHAIDQLLMISRYIIKKNCTINSSSIYNMNKYYPQICEEMMNQRKEYILNHITNNIHSGMKQGIYRKNLNINIIHILYSFILDIKSIETYNDWLNKDFDKIFNTIFLYHIRGIANKEGIAYMEKQFNKRNN